MLSPLKKEKTNSYITLDIETGKNGELLDIAIFDGQEVYFFEDWLTLLSFLALKKERCYKKIIAHNGNFDFSHLIEYLLSTEIKFEAICSNSRLVILRVYFNESTLIFIDSYNTLPYSLKELSRIFNITDKKIEIDKVYYSDMLKFKNEYPDIYYQYLKYDVISLYQVCKKFEGLLGIKFFPNTLASLSLYLFKKNYLKRNLFSLRPKLDEYITKSYAGGRVEVFRYGKHNQVFCYDINSLYPYMMKVNKYPINLPVYTKRFWPDKIGCYHVKFNQKKRNIIPILWQKTENGLEFVYNGEGYFFEPEIKLALENGTEIEFIDGYIWDSEEYLFKKFVDDYYRLRIKYKGTAVSILAKLILNSLYGKFAQKPDSWKIVKLNYDELNNLVSKKVPVKVYKEEYGLYEVKENIKINHRLIYLASYTTSLGRAYLGKYLVKYSDNLVYCDTDSLHLTTPLPDNETGSEIGKFKLEVSGEGIYTGRKQYKINDKIKFKGHKTYDKLSNKPGLNSVDLEKIANGLVVVKQYTEFPKVKSVLKGKKACKIYKVNKIASRSRYLTNYPG